MIRQLSLSARPRTLDDLVGQSKLVKRIRNGIKKSGVPKGWLFWGQKGSGKTTIARILALSVQCSHQDKFGRPCVKCRKKKRQLPIFQLNCARNRTVESMEAFVDRADYEITGQGKRKVFILDEVQELSKKAQRILLDQTEDPSNNAVWILTTTEPDKINSALRSRLKVRALKSFDRDDTLELVTRLLSKRDSELDPEALADALVEKGVTSGRLIAHAVESYYEGDSAEDAAEVDAETDVNTKTLWRAVIKGDWEATGVILKNSNASDVRPLRYAMINHLRVVLLESVEFDDRSKSVAEAIKRLAYVGAVDDTTQMGALAAELFGLCEVFSERSL